MDIRLRRTGRILYHIPTDVALALTEGDPTNYECVAVEQRDPQSAANQIPAPPKVATLVVGTTRGGLTAILLNKPSGETFYWTGPADDASQGLGCEVPQEVIEQYQTLRQRRG